MVAGAGRRSCTALGVRWTAPLAREIDLCPGRGARPVDRWRRPPLRFTRRALQELGAEAPRVVAAVAAGGGRYVLTYVADFAPGPLQRLASSEQWPAGKDRLDAHEACNFTSSPSACGISLVVVRDRRPRAAFLLLQCVCSSSHMHTL